METGGRSWRGRSALASGLRVALVVVLLLSARAQADARLDYLVRLLRTSDAFRVRAQAALSLGRLEPSKASIAALEKAVSDRHPAVRVAAISSLENLRVTRSLPVLRAAARDRNTSVRRAATEAVTRLSAIRQRPRRGPGKPRYYLAVGMPGTKDGRVSRQMLFDAQLFMSDRLLQIQGVELMPAAQSAAAATREISKRRLRGYFLDSSVVSLERKSGGVRAVVSVILGTYPGRDMRAMLRGAATAPGGLDDVTVEQAVQGAIVGALRRLPQALRSADGRSGGLR